MPKWNFLQGRQSARGEVRCAGEVVVGSIFVLAVCVCVVGEVKWSGGLGGAERFMFEGLTS